MSAGIAIRAPWAGADRRTRREMLRERRHSRCHAYAASMRAGSSSPEPALFTRVETIHSCTASSRGGRSTVAGFSPDSHAPASRQSIMTGWRGRCCGSRASPTRECESCGRHREDMTAPRSWRRRIGTSTPLAAGETGAASAIGWPTPGGWRRIAVRGWNCQRRRDKPCPRRINRLRCHKPTVPTVAKEAARARM